MTRLLFFFSLILLLASCKKETTSIDACGDDAALNVIQKRDFYMGFSTWSYGPEMSDREKTYQFISAEADIYAEQIDDYVPWNALINDTALPADFVADIDFRVAQKPADHRLLLSASLLNGERNDLIRDIDGTSPNVSGLNDPVLVAAYIKHLQYLIDRFSPDYMVMSMEVNDLFLADSEKWGAYKNLMNKVRASLKANNPGLPLSESVTLHNWFEPETDNAEAHLAELSAYVNQLDFAAISFYPFFKGMETKAEFQKAFDFLGTQVTVPIAIVETNHLAQDLFIPRWDLSINGELCEQKEYLETLLLNAHMQQFEFVIWWSFRDYDALWKSLPTDQQDAAQPWRDTGLQDENGNNRPALWVWNRIRKL